MPQSLLALLAIVTAVLLTHQSLQTRMGETADAHELEAVVQARGAAVSVLERLAAYPFDGGEGATSGATGTDAYSPAAQFGTGDAAAGTALDALFADGTRDDLDDFHGVDGAVATVALTDPETGAVRTVSFEVSVEVVYAERDGAGHWGPEASATYRGAHKLASVSVDHATLRTPLRFGRLYADL